MPTDIIFQTYILNVLTAVKPFWG